MDAKKPSLLKGGVSSLVIVAVVVGLFGLWNFSSAQFNFSEDEELYEEEYAEGTATFSGVIEDASGKPVEGVKVELSGSPGSTYGETDVDGFYEIFDIPPGEYEVSMKLPKTAKGLKAPKLKSVYFEELEDIEQDYKLSGKKTAAATKAKTVKGKKELPAADELEEDLEEELPLELKATKIVLGLVISTKDEPISNANITATRTSPTTDVVTTKSGADGAFDLELIGGSWFIIAVPAGTANWEKSTSEKVEFEVDSEDEEELVELLVETADAVLSGRVVNADGTPAKKGTVVHAISSITYSAEVGSDGSFSLSVPADVYAVSVVPLDTGVSAPSEPVQVTVSEGQSADAGTIELIKDTGRITGKVLNSKTQAGVSGVSVTASMPDSSNSQTVKTGGDGSFEISVSSGEWLVSVSTDSTKLVAENNDQPVSITGKETVTVEFLMSPEVTTVSGKLVNEKGKEVKDAEGFVLFNNDAGDSVSAVLSEGAFSAILETGSYTASVNLAPGAPYSPVKDLTVSLAAGEKTKDISLKVDSNKYEISGKILDDAGKQVTGVKVKVCASDGEGSWQDIETTDGTYTLGVSNGTWSLCVNVDEGADYQAPDATDKGLQVTIKNASAQKNLTLKRASSTISGKAVDPQGAPLANVYIQIDTTSTAGTETEKGKTLVTSASTDAAGNFTASVVKGTYYLHAYQQARKDLINPDEQSVKVASGETKAVTLTFQQTSAELSGTVMLDSGKVGANATVSAWSDRGGYVQTKANENGEYVLSVSPDVWHVSSSTDEKGKGYSSSTSAVTVEGAGEVELDMQAIASVQPLAAPVTQAASAATGTAVQNEDGVKAVLPGNATDAEGKVSLTVSETVENTRQGTVDVLGSAYNIDLRDSKGGRINDLEQPMVLTFPYDKKTMAAQGAKVENLMPAYWDTRVGVWKPLDDVTIDKKKGIITSQTTHLTRFALVSPADETPPAEPSNVSAKSQSNKVVLSWQTPGVDYHHAKIYQSEKSGVIGTLLADNVATKSYDIPVDGKTYYFVVRSIDLAGNESKNTKQVSLSAAKVKRK